MKSLITILFTAVITILIFCFNKKNLKSDAINPLIGDASFIQKFGTLPDENTNEDLRIKTHLEYVEEQLRKRNVSAFSYQLKQKRLQLLNLLHDYWTAGIFPRNYDYIECRKPCFIDKDNRICAVGYLIEKTSGRKTAETINSKHKYEEVLAMNDKAVDNWIINSGLTKKECAMIQPTYGPPPTYNYNNIPTSYGISSSALGGVNLSLNAINALQMIKGTASKTIPTIGLITGAGQVILGAASFPKSTSGTWGNTSNESKKTLSMLNIGIGTTTMIVSAWNLITKKKTKDKMTTWNIYTIHSKSNKMNVGVNFTTRL